VLLSVHAALTNQGCEAIVSANLHLPMETSEAIVRMGHTGISMVSRLKQDRARLHSGHWQTAREQTVMAESSS